MGYGIGGYLRIEKQSAFGTPVSSSPFYVPFVSESLVENKNYLKINNKLKQNLLNILLLYIYD